MTNLIKYIRNSVNLSQQRFAHELGVSFATVNRWENGKTMPSSLTQNALYEFCRNRGIDIAEYIVESLVQEKQRLEEANHGAKILFHGSKFGLDGEIKPISRPQCDFGRGFYMGTEILQPLTLICNYNKPVLYFVSIDSVNIKTLELPTDISWAFVVAYNRGKLEQVRGKNLYSKYAKMLSGYDLIIGDIADDRMFFVLDNFFEGNITDRGLVECLSTLHLGKQYVAVSPEACHKIKIIKEYTLSELELMALRDRSERNRQIGIESANEICKQHRREGKFFDELLEDNEWI